MSARADRRCRNRRARSLSSGPRAGALRGGGGGRRHPPPARGSTGGEGGRCARLCGGPSWSCRAGVRHAVYSPYLACRSKQYSTSYRGAKRGKGGRPLDEFHYEAGVLCCEDVPLSEIARDVGTPVYVYSHGALERAYRELDEAFSGLDHLVCYAVKANGNLAVLRALASFGAGADIVSVGELYRAMRAGFDPKKVVFAGVGKTESELMAGLGERILLFNVESASELEHLDRLCARFGKRARVALRVNPDVDVGTHDHVATGRDQDKFGIPVDEALALAERVGDYRCIDLIGVHQHIGSQITKLTPYTESVERSAGLVEELKTRGFDIRYFNIGGGLGIPYKDEVTPSPKELVDAIRPMLEAAGTKILCEMGRYIAGAAGVLITKVVYRKKSGERSFIVADAGMNDLLRP